VTFANSEARLNTSVMQRVSNARGSWNGGVTDFAVIFDRAQVGVLNGEISGVGPVAAIQDADLGSCVANSSRITIRGVDYIVRGIEPDSTGWTNLYLEVA
jgi:hypothetical protein